MNSAVLPPTQATHDTLQIALETTGLTGSVAVLQGEAVLRNTNLDSGKRSAAILAPVLSETLQWCRKTGNNPQIIAIADGPGSFTGLRIGVTTAKTFAYATQLPIVAVDSLAAIAATAFHEHGAVERLLVGINAYRGQVFAAEFRRDELLIPWPTAGAGEESVPATWNRHPEQVRVLDAGDWRDILQRQPSDAHVTGDQKMFADRTDLSFLDRSVPDAAGVGLLGIRAAMAGAFSDPLALVPRYLRPSAAEEKADSVKPQSA